MSLIGIDVGSSSIKIAAYSITDGKLLASFRQDLTPYHPRPGWWEQDPEEVWQTTINGLRGLVSAESVRRDPPQALAVSASGRENFPADVEGNLLGPCIMAADIRGAEFEVPPEGVSLPEPWSLSCGHLRERMDPVFRLLWWRRNHPEVMAKARYFLGWHEFLALRLAGRVVIDRSKAGRWLVYDLESGTWSPERVDEYVIDPDLLPEILPWGTIIGEVKRTVVDEVGLPPGVMLAVGGLDLTCAGVGAGILDAGTAGLVSGSFENLLIPSHTRPTAAMLLRGLSFTPHPGETDVAILALSPTGTMVLNWARKLLGVSIEELDRALEATPPSPSPVLAVPYLSGAMLHWKEGRRAKGALIGLTLATSTIDIIKAFMESIAYDHVNTLSILSEEGIRVRCFRAAGGGSRSAWWTQLKADMLNASITVVDQPEPGTLGAALLAGVAVGVFGSLEEGGRAFAGSGSTFEPDPARAAMHGEQLEAYRQLVPTLLSTVFKDG